MRNPPCWLFLVVLTAATFLSDVSARAYDLANGLMIAVPAPGGQQPSLDGSDKGWDLSGAEPLWMSTQLAKQLHATVALNYDADNLYLYVKASLPGRKLTNHNGPQERYYNGDTVELRLCSDPALKYPLNNSDPVMHVSKQVCHIMFWKDTDHDKAYTHIDYGGMHGGNQGQAFDPKGSKVVFTESENQYVMQAVLPWSALNVPDGKNPFKPGARMTTIFGLHWLTPTYFYSVNAIYSSNPGDFAFLNWQTWGQTEFSATGNLKPRHGTMEEALAKAVEEPQGVPITVDVPEAGKLSVNIVGEKGEVLREVAGGLDVQPGKITVRWDGHDQWGFPLQPGKYQWAAYFSHGLKARYEAFVGSSGNPPYASEDGKGGWGGDEGMPSAVAADDSGIYFGWDYAEAQQQIVKIDYAGNTLWRKSPVVPGGLSALYALASNGKYLYGIHFAEAPVLSRLDPATGLFAVFSNRQSTDGCVLLTSSSNTAILPAPGSNIANDWLAPRFNKDRGVEAYVHPECVGLAASKSEVFASVYSKDLIQVIDAETGKATRALPCFSPRGLALDAQGNLYAASYGANQVPQIVRFDKALGTPIPVVTSNLSAPMGVSIDAAGQINVTDDGESQQIKTFSTDGKLLRALGKKGGRPLEGKYENTSYRIPTALVTDKQGGLVVAESSIPKVCSRIDAASGKTLSRWFGWPSYYLPNVPDCDDPFTCYIAYEPRGFVRAKTSPGKSGFPEAYWDIVDNVLYPESRMGGLPYIQRMANGRKYEISDVWPHFVYAIEGDDMRPVGYIKTLKAKEKLRGVTYNPTDENCIEIWVDRNGDHIVQPDELTRITTINGKPVPWLPSVHRDSCIWMDAKGNAFLQTYDDSILEIPSDGIAKNGSIQWNAAKARYAVPVTLPCSGFGPVKGVRTDSVGNIYAVMSATRPALTPAIEAKIQTKFPSLPRSDWSVFATPELAKHMMEGLGHTAESNIAKFAKYSPEGKLLWMAGRKATAAAKPGEIYHFYTMAGIVGDDYVAGGTQWGTISFYTSDGFYVDTIMNDPGALPPAGPYTFSSETMGGRVQGFEKLGKVYAYNWGGIYAVDGFDKNLKVQGERRMRGSVELDKVYETAQAPELAASNIQLVPISGDIAAESTWAFVPKSTVMYNSEPLATAQAGYDGKNLYAKFHVVDNTPLQNGGDDPKVIFKSGDVVGLDLGPAGDRTKPALGDLRILAAHMKGQDRLIAMKPLSQKAKNPQSYFTPASGTKPFDFVGDIPGGKAVLTADADGKGYTALMTVPRSFLEFPIAPGAPLKGDVEVLLSGMKSQGLQSASRHWLFSYGHSETTMTDDIPTEAWLYPQYWGDVSVK